MERQSIADSLKVMQLSLSVMAKIVFSKQACKCKCKCKCVHKDLDHSRLATLV